MTDCSQLPAMLDEAIQTRNALNSPTYCEDNFDTITEQQLCRKRLPQQKQEADQSIADVQQQISLCSLFGGTWGMTVDVTLEGIGHFEGTLNFTGALAGTITLPGESGLSSTPFIGQYTADTQTIILRRSLTLNPPGFGDGLPAEVYTGTANFDAQQPTMMGSMAIDPGPDGVTDLRQYSWSAQKQS